MASTDDPHIPTGGTEVLGTVLRSTGSHYRVRLDRGGEVMDELRLRGKFRQADLKATNPLAVGDRVRVLPAKQLITAIEPRRNHLLRQSTRSHSQYQILAANIDQAILVVTIEYPFTPLGFIDRFLVMSEAYHIPATLVFNKLDLLKATDKYVDKLIDYHELYEALDYRVVPLSATNPADQPKIEALLQGKVSFLAGKSGAGKSSLVNLADPVAALPTRALSGHSQKGKHTTTFAEMHRLQLSQGTADVIDAPGLAEFDVAGLAPEELSHYYVEMRACLNDCRFRGCLHLKEPGCAVKAAVETGSIARSRYHTYLNILDELHKQQPY